MENSLEKQNPPQELKKGRRPIFKEADDELITKSWLAITRDPILGTDQSGETCYSRIAYLFNDKVSLKYSESCVLYVDPIMQHEGLIPENVMWVKLGMDKGQGVPANLQCTVPE